MDPHISRIVLTGGPCAGKSTALDMVGTWLTTCGFGVFRIPEASTILLAGGIVVAGQPLPLLQASQRGIVELQLTLENAFLHCARASNCPSILLLDRGIPDGSAYLPEPAWSDLLGQLGLDHASVRDERYDTVVHLMTAAIGAENHYGTATNPVRYETLEEARDVDERLRQAWRGHPRLSIIDNAGDFDNKMQRVLLSVCDAVGAPMPERRSSS